MDKSVDRTSMAKKAVRVVAWAGAMALTAVWTLGNPDRNAASSQQRTSNGTRSVRAAEASAVAAQADPGTDDLRVPGHSELDLQLD